MREEKAAGGVGGCREDAVICPDPDVSQDGGRGGAIKDQDRGQPHQAHSRGKSPQRIL